jgi:prepilin-type N-terminal cleavage/methylation domain-containing protein
MFTFLRSLRRTEGFTLIELLVAVAVLSAFPFTFLR